MPMQIVELHFEESPTWSRQDIANRAGEILQSDVEAGAKDESSANIFIHVDSMVEYTDAEVPAQTVVFPMEQVPELEKYDENRSTVLAMS